MNNFNLEEDPKWQTIEETVVLASIEEIKKLRESFGIIIVKEKEIVDDQFMKKVFNNEIHITCELYIGIYGRLQFEVTRGLSKKYILVSDEKIENKKLMMLRMTQMKKKIVYIPEQPKEVEVAMRRKVDRSEKNTYTKHAAEYVAESYERRVSDLEKILRPFVAAYNITKIVAPNDGAGSAYKACKLIGVECFSGDPTPQMVEQSKLKGNMVSLIGAKKLLDMHPQGVVVVSHSETIDPGVVAMVLARNRQIIVYELSEVYLGYSKLIENMIGVRSVYDIKIPVCTSIVMPRLKNTAWYKMSKYGASFYISDWKCVKHLKALHALGVPVTVSTECIKVAEMCKVMGFRMHKYSGADVGVYWTEIDKRCSMLFSLREGRFHKPFRGIDAWKNNVYLYGIDSQYTVKIGCHTYGRYTGAKQGPNILTKQMENVSSKNMVVTKMFASPQGYTQEEQDHWYLYNGSDESGKGLIYRRGKWYPPEQWQPYTAVPEGVGLDKELDGLWEYREKKLYAYNGHLYDNEAIKKVSFPKKAVVRGMSLTLPQSKKPKKLERRKTGPRVEKWVYHTLYTGESKPMLEELWKVMLMNKSYKGRDVGQKKKERRKSKTRLKT